MSDGQVERDRVWFSFDLRELEWLHDLIPSGDEFRRDVAKAIRKLERGEREVKGGKGDE
jgi:hypothetical protein